jgi:hypothetical protein
MLAPDRFFHLFRHRIEEMAAVAAMLGIGTLTGIYDTAEIVVMGEMKVAESRGSEDSEAAAAAEEPAFFACNSPVPKQGVYCPKMGKLLAQRGVF